MATLASSSFPHLILRRFILRRPFPSVFHSVLPSLRPKHSYFPLRTTPFSTSSPIPSAVSEQLASDVVFSENAQNEYESEIEAISAATEASKKVNFGVVKSPPPPRLSVKEKKELASYAHSLGKKLKSQQVGKSGVTDTVVMALLETLEKNELLKLKIHGTCPGELEDVVKHLEEATGSVVVGQIGRTVILYRPSLTKMKAEEKKKQAQSVYLKKLTMSRQSPQSRRQVSVAGEETRQFNRGRRGRSRF